VGLARSGAAAARALRERGERVIGVDAGAASRGGDATSVADELAELGVEVHLRTDGAVQRAHLDRVRAVIKSPGVPAQAPVIASARARGIPVLGELEFAWRLLANEFIAVTGTNGKTTTVEWIGHIHREAGLPVAVAGNVGTALSGLAERVEERAVVVCETSSFQLEDTLAFAPEAAVLLNITPDHLDRHGTMDAYREAKLQIFARQQEADVAVIPLSFAQMQLGGSARRVCFGESESESAECASRGAESAECVLREGCLWWRGQPLLAVEELSLRGAHNAQNAMAAAAVCLARGLDRDAVRAGLRSFAGVTHRLQVLARRDGVLYVNDSKATNVASTIVALRAFPEGGVHLILGGQGKGQDFTPLREPIAASCRGVYLIGEDAPRIAAALEGVALPREGAGMGREGAAMGREGAAMGREGAAMGQGGTAIPLRECGDLERAVAAASAAASAGETVLLSPACASFDQFADYEARGEQFVALVAGGV
jgi:UDP-N-acetylmuramoylalanine--D-glutamate ligase